MFPSHAPVSQPLAIKPGDLIDGRYRIVGDIADGGMGTVMLAEHALIRRRFAIKFLHRELASDTAMVKRFLNEALAAGTLGHPHIVEATDMGFTPDQVPYIVFEYLEGALLTEEIYRLGGLPVRRALRIALRIASALDAAHSAGIVHLDLKSDNVFLIEREGDFDHAKVLDFGISRFMEADVGRTHRGLLMGTPEFMAPEQIEDPESVDERADVYALGVLLYEMLSARRPFSSGDARVLIHRIVHAAPPPLAVAGVPPRLERLIFDRMLAKAPADRPRRMREVSDELEAILAAMTFAQGSSPRIELTPAAALVAPEAAVSPALAPTAPVAVPAVRSRKAARACLAMSAVLAFAAAAQSELVPAPTDHREAELRAAVDHRAAQLSALLTAKLRTTQDRAEAIAIAPMMRAAIETDAATIDDLARGGSLFALSPGESLEIALRRGDKLAPALRTGDSAPAAAPRPVAARVERFGDGIRVVTTVPVHDRAGEATGMLAFATSVDLSSLRDLSGVDTLRLFGLGAPIALIAGDRRGDLELLAPLHGLPLTLVATFTAAPAPPSYATVQRACAALAFGFLLVFAGLAMRRRPVA